MATGTGEGDGLFGDRLDAAVRRKGSVAVVGIDPTVALLPPDLAGRAAEGSSGLYSALSDFCIGIVLAVADLVPAVKPNIAFFEAFGMHGLSVYKSVCLTAADAGLLVIGDVKRGDIGSTAAAYASGLLDAPKVPLRELSDANQPEAFQALVGVLLGPHDALTLNPYLGSDSIEPFVERGAGRGQGFFVLVKTSNPSSRELQDLRLADGGTVAERTALLVDGWGADSIGESGLSSVGAVVGATHPAELGRYRELMPAAPFLIPGYGAQGGAAADVVPAFRPDGSGAVVNASRSILQAWKKEDTPDDWIGAARRAVTAMNTDLRDALTAAGKWCL
ncbi:MAG: orotidine-5'-phosphate decarboxylase [Planctomycetes bacterium]|nr:orotidine-5'-phosphate decarboxylase [Planctomycetota bacterium]